VTTPPATRTQVGALHGQFRRLGFPRWETSRDRAARLAACAALLGIDRLDSTRDLTMGQAGILIHDLPLFTSRDDLPRPVSRAHRERFTHCLLAALERISAGIAEQDHEPAHNQ